MYGLLFYKSWKYVKFHPANFTFMWPCIVTFMWPCIVTNFLIIKPTRRSNCSNLFWNETLRVSDSSSAHHQELFTVHSAMVYVIELCRQLERGLQTCMPCTIAECTVNNSWWWAEELSETCRVSFQNKFEKLVRLVGFIIRKFTQQVEGQLQPVFACETLWLSVLGKLQHEFVSNLLWSCYIAVILF
jgi:hypothetical protein